MEGSGSQQATHTCLPTDTANSKLSSIDGSTSVSTLRHWNTYTGKVAYNQEEGNLTVDVSTYVLIFHISTNLKLFTH